MTINYGIMGGSQVATVFAKAINKIKNAQITAVASRDLMRAQDLATQLQVSKAYGSYLELCEDPNVDVVYISVYNQAHYECAKLALEYDKHVLLETPFTQHKTGANELFLLANKKQRFLMEMQYPLFSPLLNQVKDLLKQDVLGKVCYLEIKKAYDVSQHTWFNELAAGGGALNLGGSTILETVAYLLEQKPRQWSGNKFSVVGQADQNCTLNFKCGDTLVNSVIATDFALTDEMVIVGQKGKLVIPNWTKAQVAFLKTATTTKEYRVDDLDDAWLKQVQHVNECLQKQALTSDIVTPALTLNALDAIEELYQKWYGDPLN